MLKHIKIYLLDKRKHKIMGLFTYLFASDNKRSLIKIEKIVKEIDLNNLERDFIQFIQAIHTVDAMYKSL